MTTQDWLKQPPQIVRVGQLIIKATPVYQHPHLGWQLEPVKA